MGKNKVTDNVKWQIVGLLKDGCKTQQEIAELVGVSQKCVSSIKKKHESTGQVSDLRRSGRPRKLNFRHESYIFREIRKNPTLSYINLAVDFNAKFSNVKVSKATIRRLLIKKGLESHTAVRKPLLTAEDRIKRYKWCKQRLNWTVNDWGRNPEDYLIFQQDGASAHTAYSIRDWFKEQNIEVLPWCIRSPDLSPIENLWSFMYAKLVNTRITSIDDLKQVLHKDWLSVSTEYVQNLINSMPERVAAFFRAKGGHFKY
ncbi:unnamed protein product [Brachionus calyciflorus]|uniref:Transposase Tc1-like domain-containing protein n=1 Tax=Brachionus calyciflorus TaxID=104777 RepID=A0A814JPE8_9BILA|nr:unnamed protein product [Brachionus calyciflorus]